MSRERRREMVDREHPALSTLRQCFLYLVAIMDWYSRYVVPAAGRP